MVDPSVLTDATHPVLSDLLTAEVLAAKGFLSPSESLVMRAELERLSAVEEEFRTILGRKAVSMAMRIADSRHLLRTRKRQSPKVGQ
jgi:hypothetical protein